MVPALVALVLVLGAQIQIGEVRGRVADAEGGVLVGASVLLYDTSSGFDRRIPTDATGAFALRNVPHGLYTLRIEMAGFRAHEATVVVDSNLVVERETIVLALAGPSEAVTVRAETPLLATERAASVTRLDETLVERVPAGAAGEIQALAATVAGWSTEDNGLLHARGVDDGFLYVTNGIPVSDRVDTFFSNALDVEAFESVEIIDGHLPVEYGNTSGGVINIVPRSGLGGSWSGTLTTRIGSERLAGISGTIGGAATDEVGVFVATSYRGSGERFLDPVDPDNLNNRGAAGRLAARLDWQWSERDVLIGELSTNGSGFRVTNTFAQELAGQRQRQELRDNHQSLIWQRSWSRDTVTDASIYRRGFAARLFPSERDTPISAQQDRRHGRLGALFNVTREAGGHLLKAGATLERVTPRERFLFFVTDEEAAEDAGVSDEAASHGPENPFVFEGRATRGQGSAFVQDTFSPAEGLTMNAGVRFDATRVLVADSAFSPRLGAVYYLPRWEATLRASYNRLFMPPQVENLLLSSSEEARALSPFESADEEASSGGAEVRPERQHAYEVGLAKAFGRRLLLDVAYWRRSFRNQADPNVFFGTTIVFPNAVAEGEARGVNLRLEFPLYRGLSGFASYGNAVVYQRGPVNGGLFLEDEVLEIGPGTRYTPDHDQRNVGSFGITYLHRSTGLWLALYGRHESGTPLEVDDDALDAISDRRGVALVDLDRMRVKPRTLFDVSAGAPLIQKEGLRLELQVDLRNLTDRAFAYNFSNPFSGTHFGHPRLLSFRVKIMLPGDGSRP